MLVHQSLGLARHTLLGAGSPQWSLTQLIDEFINPLLWLHWYWGGGGGGRDEFRGGGVLAAQEASELHEQFGMLPAGERGGRKRE